MAAGAAQPPPPLSILPIYSQLPATSKPRFSKKQKKDAASAWWRPTSERLPLTVDGIYYVIDCGYSKVKVYNPKMEMDALQVFPISRAAADQRSGRAGRTGPGTAYGCRFEGRTRTRCVGNPVPEIQRTNLGNVVLLLKSLNIDNLLDFDSLDPPPQENILNSMYQFGSGSAR